MVATTGTLKSFTEKAVQLTPGLMKSLETDAIYPQIVKQENTNQLTVRKQELENMGSFARWPEMAPFPILDMPEGFAKGLTQNAWAGRVLLSKQIEKFDQWDVAAALIRNLRYAGVKCFEIIGATYLEEGDTAQASVTQVGGAPLINSIGGDGSTLFATNHPFRSTTDLTWSNKAATYVDLDEDGIKAVYDVICGWKDNTGAPLNIMPTTIIYPVPLTQDFLKLQHSLLEPQTGNNAINSKNLMFKGGGIQNKWLSSAVDWYAMTDADETSFSLYFLWGWKNDSFDGMDTNTQARFISLSSSLASGANVWRRMFGIKQ